VDRNTERIDLSKIGQSRSSQDARNRTLVVHERSDFLLLFSIATVGTIDIGTNTFEPTSECGLRNRENPFEPTTPLPSPQKGKAEASEISDTFC